MLVVGLVLSGLAAALHVYIFALESLWWRTRARAVFGTSAEEAEATAELAFNQGFYNLFLAVGVAIGIVLIAIDERAPGNSLVLFSTGSMVAAALVLLLSSPAKAKAALTQMTLPLLGALALTLSLL